MKFAPLHIYSGYSLLQSGLSFDRLFATAKKNNVTHLALSDKYSLSGIPLFIELCKKNNIKPLVGCDFNFKLLENTFTCSLYCLNEDGYRSLVKLVSLSHHQEIDINSFKDELKNVVCILPTISNPFSLLKEDTHALASFSNLFFDFYLGIENYDNKEVQKVEEIRSFGHSHSYKMLAFPWIKYIKPSDAITLKIVQAIDKEEVLEEKELSGPNYFPSDDTIIQSYHEDELENTIKLVDQSTFDFNVKRGSLLTYVDNDKEVLTKLCYEGLTRLDVNDDKHKERLEYELNVISSMGYCSYFLIVSDYVHFAKNHDILVGPGRGSAAGSLVSYLLGITMIDPLDYDLLFERFLNKDRVTMPDIDIDFEDIKREQIVQYLISKYGRERVANIITYQTIGAKQSIRDIGRVYQYPGRDIDLLAKAIPDNKIDLHNAYKKVPAFRNLVDSDNYYLEIIRLASKIEGLPRNTSLHAAGIILNNDSILNSLPINIDSAGNMISQFEMTHLEDQGFLKMDLLGLRNLTIIHKCLNLIKKNKGIDLKYEDIKYDIPEIYKMISSKLTSGVFQLESSGMLRAIEKLQPENFNDIVAILALFRPGPMDQIEEYARRKSGVTKVTYLVPALEPILKSTYGIIIYQEQIMQIAQVIAGFSLAQADIFRRAISKKDITKMEALKADFINGGIKQGYTSTVVTNIYNQILKFANYGFNKSHSVCYAAITCQMAYLKYKYPYEFYIALLEVGSSSNDTKFGEYISEIKKQGFIIHLPDINISGYEYDIYDNGLIIPFSSIRGIKKEIVEAIIYERQKNGKYQDFYDFCVRIMPFGINDTQIIRLIDAGCFDKINPSRASLRANVPNAIKYAMLFVGDTQQMSLFSPQLSDKPRFINVEDDPLENFEFEYDALGITISKTILSYKQDILKAQNIKTISEIKNTYATVKFACILKSKKVIKTKKGTPMAFLKVFDEENEIEVTVFSKTYADSLMLLESNNVLVITGYYQKDKDSIVANTISLLEE